MPNSIPLVWRGILEIHEENPFAYLRSCYQHLLFCSPQRFRDRFFFRRAHSDSYSLLRWYAPRNHHTRRSFPCELYMDTSNCYVLNWQAAYAGAADTWYRRHPVCVFYRNRRAVLVPHSPLRFPDANSGHEPCLLIFCQRQPDTKWHIFSPGVPRCPRFFQQFCGALAKQSFKVAC